ncbi:preprotein translocase subunit SecG [Afifella sp. IM 167]|uniref:preprotein translocase subunit SecG n=1 Tax=Afifella sp. IM 167 TaxID=2033586 RepID=UPI001CC94248|nr:preprotein translocase subunit SecG [Afifella sp. IM 167]MBZ8132337.1 preprotein translocase subunit SecG [Afifella sp. IM 167]
MTTVLIVIHLMVVLAMIALVLLQRSEGGALGIGGGGGMMTGRGAGNLLTRSTAILAAAFFLTSIGLTVLARLDTGPGDIFERLQTQEPAQTVPAEPAGSGDAQPSPVTPPTTENGAGPGVLDALRNPRTSGQPVQQPSSPAPSAPSAPTPPTPSSGAPSSGAPASSGATAPQTNTGGPQVPPAENSSQ